MKSKDQKYIEAVWRNMKFLDKYVKNSMNELGLMSAKDDHNRGKVLNLVKHKIGIRQSDAEHSQKLLAHISMVSGLTGRSE